MELKVNKLTSAHTQLPYNYYVLPYCQPEAIKENVENLGEILAGDVIENSPYVIRMLENSSCSLLCTKSLTKAHLSKFRSMIDDSYTVNWIVDNLPAATRYKSADQLLYVSGFPVGAKTAGVYRLYNHVSLHMKYHADPANFDGYRVVGFEVEPDSLSESDCTGAQMLLNDVETLDVPFTYTVSWSASDVRWASRWDTYLKMSAVKVHWFAIVNSLMIVFLLTGVIAVILLRTLHRDILKYNELATAEDAAEETGWKLVHADVFRKPHHSKLLAVCIGSGVQTLGMAIVTLFFALLGFLSPAHRGGLLQSVMLIFTFMGAVAGYVAAKVSKIWNSEEQEWQWKLTTILTALLFPGITFIVFFMLNLLIWGQKSSGAVPFTTMFALLVLWFGISVPLVFLGAYFAVRGKPVELPVRTNHIPRQIPEQQFVASPRFLCLLSGIVPFCAVYTELFFIMSSLWQHQFYCLFGFLTVVVAILAITCAEMSITLTYFQLTIEDYNWWWCSFTASASSGFYVFLYSIWYFHSRLAIDRMVSTILYFGYMFLIATFFGLLTGSIGAISTFYFVKGIYGSIKID